MTGAIGTMSKVFAARSLTKGLAMTGMRCEAVRWPFWLLMRSSDMADRDVMCVGEVMRDEVQSYGGNMG